MIYRVFVEKKENLQAKKIRDDLAAQLGIIVEDLREIIRYDAEGLTAEELEGAIINVFFRAARRSCVERRTARQCGL